MFFEYPKLLWLLLLLIPLIALYLYRELKGRTPSLQVSSLDSWRYKPSWFKRALRHLPFLLRLAALALVIVAIARPRDSKNFEKVDTEGLFCLEHTLGDGGFREVQYLRTLGVVEVLLYCKNGIKLVSADLRRRFPGDAGVSRRDKNASEGIIQLLYGRQQRCSVERQPGA